MPSLSVKHSHPDRRPRAAHIWTKEADGFYVEPTWVGERLFVCNPPFKDCNAFVKHALTLATYKVAMIWLARRLNAARWLEQTPLARIYFLTPRPSMPPGDVILAGEKPRGGSQDFCWLTWEHGHRGPPSMHWLYRGTRARERS